MTDRSETGEHIPTGGLIARTVELAGVVVYLCLIVVALAWLGVVFTELRVDDFWWTVGSAFILSILFADFSSGFFHWLADNWGHPEMKIIGPALIGPFREHHVDPEAMTRHSFVEVNGNNCIITMPLFYFALTQPFLDGPDATFATFVAVFNTGTAMWIFGTNQFHSWAHTPNPPWIVRALQASRIILAVPHHNEHHRPPHSVNYCITNGWMNYPLRWLRFYEILEWCITKITGIKPAHFLLETQLARDSHGERA